MHWLLRTIFVLNRFRRIPNHRYAFRNIPRNHSSRPNNRIISNADSWKNYRSSAYPYVRTNSDRLRTLPSFKSDLWVSSMVCSVQLNIWANAGTISNVKAGHVEEDAVEVYYDVFAEMNVEAELAYEY